MRSVCGCIPTSSAATLIMYRGRSGSVTSGGCPLQLLEQLALLLVHLLGDLDLDPREHIALAGAFEARRAAALDAQELPVLGPCRHRQLHGAVWRRHLDLRAERGGRIRDRHRDDQVVAAPLVDL